MFIGLKRSTASESGSFVALRGRSPKVALLLRVLAVSVSVFALACLHTSAAAAEKSPKPDPAAHTVIVPYDGKQPAVSAKPDRYYLDYADFQRLWSLAKENRKPDRPATESASGKAEALITSALYDAEVIETGLRVKARYHVITRGPRWAKLELPFKSGTGNLAASGVMLNGQPVALQDNVVLIEDPGTHVVDATLELGLERGWKNVALILPRAGAGVLSVTVPRTDGRPSFVGGQAGVVTEQEREGRRTFTLPLLDSTSLTFTRSPLLRLVSDLLPAQVDTRVELRVLPRLDQVIAAVRFSFPGTERKALSLELDPDLRLESANVSPEGAVTLRKADAKQFLDVEFTRTVASTAFVNVTAVRVLDDASTMGTRRAPKVHGVAARENLTLELIGADDLQVRSASEFERVESTVKEDAGTQRIGAWRIPQGRDFSYVVAPGEDRSEAKLETVYQISAQKAEIIAAITLNSGRGSLQEARIGLPADFEVQALAGPRVVAWHREGNDILIRFDAQAQSEARLVLHAARTLASPVAAWTLESLKLPRFAKQSSTVRIASHAADDVKLTFDTADRMMREVDPRTLSSDVGVNPPMQVQRALRAEKAGWTAQVTLARQAPRFSVDAVLLAQAGDLGLRLSQQVGVNVEQGAVGSVKVRLPADLPEARVRGVAVRDAQSAIVNGVREYTISFQTEALARADFSLEIDLPLEGEKTLPVIQVDGASRTQRFVIVDNAGTREMKLDDAGAVSATNDGIPWLPEGLALPQFYRAPDNAAIKLTFTQLESTAGNAAIVTLAEITTALRSSGERWDVVVYSLSNRSLQFLPVRLPAKAELVEVSVGGQTVRADRAESAGQNIEGRGAEYLVPLIQMRAGELSQQVRLVYRLPGDDRGLEATHRLDDPELIGLSAERTLWNVWVPGGYEARKFDGNMDEVGAEGRELEKERSLLSEISRLNRVVSSTDVYYDDAKMAWDNAKSAIEDLKRRGEIRKGKTSSMAEGKPAASKKVKELEDDVAKQIEEQGALVIRNAGNLTQVQGKTRAKAQVAGKAGQIEIVADNTWNENKTASKAVSGPQMVANLQGQTFFNDFVCVDSNFLGKPAAPITKVGAGNWVISGNNTNAVIAPQGLDLNGNSRAVQNLQTLQAEQAAAIPVPAGTVSSLTFGNTGNVTVSGSGAITLGGVNTYTGTTTINAGTLTLNAVGRADFSNANGEQMVQQARELAKNGRYADARQLALAAANTGAGNSAVTFMKQLDDVDRYEPALSPQHDKTLTEVDRHLQFGYSYYNLGDYDRSNKSFQEALRLDPNNSAARRGMERAEQKRSEYFDTARDHTRAKMLNEVNRGWEDKPPGFVDLNGAATRVPMNLPGITPPPPAADPFAPAAPAAVAVLPGHGQVLGQMAPPATLPQQPALPALDAMRQQVTGGFGTSGRVVADVAPFTPQLKPVGRVSLAVEVPLSGSVFHFSKVKDHAAIEVTVVEPWASREKSALWTLLGGIVLFGGIGWVRRKK